MAQFSERSSVLQERSKRRGNSSLSEILQKHLSTLIAFQTIAGENGAKKECLCFIEETFFKRAEILHGEVSGCPYLLLEHPHPQLLWFAHIDVVPAKEEQFRIHREGDTLFGRGVKDMKGAALPFLLAYKEACERGENPKVSILLTSDEEVAGQTIPTLLKENILKTPVAFTPDTGSNPHIVTEHKGAMWAELRAEGRGTHGAMPWSGKNPIHLLAEAIEKLRVAFPEGREEDWHMTVIPTELKGSRAKNQIPDSASCTLDIRFPPELCSTGEEAAAHIRKYLPKGCSLIPFIITPPLKTDPAHPMVQLVKRIAEDVTGEEVKIGREHGATDARYFGAAGIPAFLYGPKGGDLHGSQEWVSLSSLLQHYEFSKRLLQAFSDPPRAKIG